MPRLAEGDQAAERAFAVAGSGGQQHPGYVLARRLKPKPTRSGYSPATSPLSLDQRGGFILHLLWWLESTGAGGVFELLWCWWFQCRWGV